VGAAAVAEATAEEPCVCRRFASDFFVRSFFPVRHPCQAALVNASTGIGLLLFRTEHRMKSVMTTFKCVVA
jgi:hypothetical protein